MFRNIDLDYSFGWITIPQDITNYHGRELHHLICQEVIKEAQDQPWIAEVDSNKEFGVSYRFFSSLQEIGEYIWEDWFKNWRDDEDDIFSHENEVNPLFPEIKATYPRRYSFFFATQAVASEVYVLARKIHRLY